MLYENTNAMPKHADGTVLHLGVKRGEGDGDALQLMRTGAPSGVLMTSFSSFSFSLARALALYVLSVANRVVSVGSIDRARMLADMLDGGQAATYESSRGFTVFTGEMLGVPVSIIATGMVRACVR